MSKISWNDSGRRTLVTTKEVVKEIPTVVPIQDTLDIDTLLQRGLTSISRMMTVIVDQSTSGTFDRETVQNLKDIMGILEHLKKRESELLDDLTDEELESLSKK